LCDGFFQDRVSRTICPGWPPTSILLISVSWVASITGMSHWYPAQLFLIIVLRIKKLKPREVCVNLSEDRVKWHSSYSREAVPIRLFVVIELFHMWVVPYASHQPCVAIKHLNVGTATEEF
jgi:hypothetical protein